MMADAVAAKRINRLIAASLRDLFDGGGGGGPSASAHAPVCTMRPPESFADTFWFLMYRVCRM